MPSKDTRQSPIKTIMAYHIYWVRCIACVCGTLPFCLNATQADSELHQDGDAIKFPCRRGHQAMTTLANPCDANLLVQHLIPLFWLNLLQKQYVHVCRNSTAFLGVLSSSFCEMRPRQKLTFLPCQMWLRYVPGRYPLLG